MSVSVTIREVNQHTSAVFERVRAGENLVVTRDGQPVARVTPYQPLGTYEQMIADGRLLPAVNTGPLTDFHPVRASVDIEAILDEERADQDFGL